MWSLSLNLPICAFNATLVLLFFRLKTLPGTLREKLSKMAIAYVLVNLYVLRMLAVSWQQGTVYAVTVLGRSRATYLRTTRLYAYYRLGSTTNVEMCLSSYAASINFLESQVQLRLTWVTPGSYRDTCYKSVEVPLAGDLRTMLASYSHHEALPSTQADAKGR